MKRYCLLKKGLMCWFLLGLAGCQGGFYQNGNYPVSAPTTLSPGSRITEKLMPGVLIEGVKPKVILDTAMRERLKKGMIVDKKDAYSLSMTITVPNVQKPTEAKMVYTLYPYQQGLWLTTRVYQVTEPGTDAEISIDVTHKAGREVQLELKKIAEKWLKR